jgi:hypothetical protein
MCWLEDITGSAAIQESASIFAQYGTTNACTLDLSPQESRAHISTSNSQELKHILITN